MLVEKITIETVRWPSDRVEKNVVIFWTEDGVPHTVPDVDHNICYTTKLADDEKFEILTPTVAALHETEGII